MAWQTIRRATVQDEFALEASAERFAHRHGIESSMEFNTWVDEVEYHCLKHEDEWGDPYYLRLWHKCVGRALGDRAAEGIAHGYVGYSCD